MQQDNHPITTSLRSACAAIVSAGLVLAMTGCGLGTAVQDGPVAGPALKGKLYGGQQPVSGATLQLYAASTTDYGDSSIALFTSSVTSGPDGSFSFNGNYTCPSANSMVYITATGGNPGYSNNPNLAMMAALGPCSNVASAFIFIDEVTTVGAVWALSPFMNDLTHIGAPASNAAGLAKAFADVNTLVDTVHGTSPGSGLPTGTVVPSDEINSLANIIASCVNSGGGTAGDGSACGALFAAAKPGTIAPTDTVTAALNMAQNPSLNVGSLFKLASSTPPFQPSLGTAPTNFALAVKFTGVVNHPTALAMDSAGNVWLANAGNNTVTELAPNGAVLSGSGFTASLNQPSAIAVDASDGVWITNKGNNTVSRLLSSGTAMVNSPCPAASASTTLETHGFQTPEMHRSQN
jgi:hypothetical protein